MKTAQYIPTELDLKGWGFIRNNKLKAEYSLLINRTYIIYMDDLHTWFLEPENAIASIQIFPSSIYEVAHMIDLLKR